MSIHKIQIKNIVQAIKVQIKEMRFTDHLYLWIIPCLALLILMSFYFSQNESLVSIVSPKQNWEWGILENLQLVIVLCITVMTLVAFVKLNRLVLKICFGAIFLFSLFVFLEETDYGAHYFQFVSGNKQSILHKYTGIYNIHNKNDGAKYFKRPVYLLIALTFVLMPFYNPFAKTKLKELSIFFTPPIKLILTVIVLILADLIPRFIVWFNIRPDGGLGTNIGEFSELIMYYLFFIYIIHCYIKIRALNETATINK